MWGNLGASNAGEEGFNALPFDFLKCMDLPVVFLLFLVIIALETCVFRT